MNLPIAITRRVGRLTLLTQKHSPTILFASGVVGVVATTVLASKATLNLEKVLVETNTNFGLAKDLHETGNPDYSDREYLEDRVKIWLDGVVKVSKLYAPAIVIGTASIACLTGSHIVLQRRNAGLMVAYAGLEKAYNEYRQRVSNDVGPDKEMVYRYPTEPSTEKSDKNNLGLVPDATAGQSMYARFFDEFSGSWVKNAEYNHIFIRCQQNYANDLLRARGHIFLNEVYDMLGMDRTKAGSVVGWLIGTESTGECYVDFGLYDDRPSSRNFVNGRSESILLDFNVDGVIYDKI